MKSTLRGLLFASTVVAGCVPHQDIRADGPVKSGDITVAIVDQTCTGIVEKNGPPPVKPMGVHLRLRIVNEGDTTVNLIPSRIRLVDGTVSTEPVQAGAPQLLAGGCSVVLNLDFAGTGNLRCSQTPVVSLGQAIDIGFIDIKFPLLTATAQTHGV